MHRAVADGIEFVVKRTCGRSCHLDCASMNIWGLEVEGLTVELDGMGLTVRHLALQPSWFSTCHALKQLYALPPGTWVVLKGVRWVNPTAQ